MEWRIQGFLIVAWRTQTFSSCGRITWSVDMLPEKLLVTFQ